MVASQLCILIDKLRDRFARLNGLILDNEQFLDHAGREGRNADRRRTRFDPTRRLKKWRSLVLRSRLR